MHTDSKPMGARMLYNPKSLWWSPEAEANNGMAYHWLLEIALNRMKLDPRRDMRFYPSGAA